MIYLFFFHLKRLFYKWFQFSRVKIRGRVISVGNLSLGGSGKTPFVHLLLRIAEQNKLSTAAIYRSYKAENAQAARVEFSSNLLQMAQKFGDEASLTQMKFSQVDVYCGGSKSQSAQLADQTKKYDITIIDDGFQHWKLERDVDIVLIDATLPPAQAKSIPIGYFRESLKSLKRADIIVLTKTNWTANSQLQDWRKLLSSYSFFELPYDNSKAVTFADFKRGDQKFGQYMVEPLALASFSGKSFAVVAGLARNEVFMNSLRKQGLQIQKSFLFDDHHVFTKAEVEEIQDCIQEQKIEGLILTEKDAIKLIQTNWRVHLVLIPQVEIQKNEKVEALLQRILTGEKGACD